MHTNITLRLITLRLMLGAAVSLPLASLTAQETATTSLQETAVPSPANPENRVSETLLLVVGSPGTEEYAEVFSTTAEQWTNLANSRGWQMQRIQGTVEEKTAKEQLQAAVQGHQSSERLWLVFLGHGTYGKGVAKFNLVGPDVSSKDLKKWLAGIPAQVILLNCSSASAPFLPELADDKRVVVTATKSGAEYNYSRFGSYLADAALNLENDLDHDREVSLLEAFLAASDSVERFYQQEGRLTTEHALLNDNGDKAGTTADFYRGVRPAKESQGGEIDGAVASRVILLSSPEAVPFPKSLEQQRERIETEIDRLRNRKSLLPETEYLEELERLMLQLAALYDRAEDEPQLKVEP